VEAVGEGANMPSTLEATAAFQQAGVLFAPAKAANAGGVAVSALEMSQNSQRLSWTFEEVDAKLKDIMVNIFAKVDLAAHEYAKEVPVFLILLILPADYTAPCAIIASATFRKPAMFAPAT